MKRWTVEFLPWDQFDATKVDARLLGYAKAASLVEANAGTYVKYLHRIFKDRPEMHDDITEWGQEESQHGRAHRAWAEKADPDFDYEGSMARFQRAFEFPLDAENLRGSQALELVNRCVIETGTSSFYTALRDVSDEPVFREICRRIAGDEMRHYNLFYQHFMKFYASQVGRMARTKMVLTRIMEVTDEELCFAYAAANLKEEVNPKDLPIYAKQYLEFMSDVFGPNHLKTAIQMVGRAAGFPIGKTLSAGLANVSHRMMRYRVKAADWFSRPQNA